jgi:hypothetical protein
VIQHAEFQDLLEQAISGAIDRGEKTEISLTIKDEDANGVVRDIKITVELEVDAPSELH